MVAALLKKTEDKHMKAMDEVNAEVQKLREEIQTLHANALEVSLYAVR